MTTLKSLAALAVQGLPAGFKTPHTGHYLAMGYTAIGIIIGGYLLFLWRRYAKTKR